MKKIILIIAVAFASCNSNQKECNCQKQIDSLKNEVSNFYMKVDTVQWEVIENERKAIERFGKQNEMNNLIIQNM